MNLVFNITTRRKYVPVGSSAASLLPMVVILNTKFMPSSCVVNFYFKNLVKLAITLILLFSWSLSKAEIAINFGFYEAVRQNNTGQALELLDTSSAGVNFVSGDGTTALHWAVYNNNEKLVKALIKKKVNVNVTNDYGSSPLIEAVEIGNLSIVKRLVRAGANVNSSNLEGQTALMTVARTNHVDVAKFIIRKGADIHAKEQWRGQTALMWAAGQSQPEMVKLLVKQGANVNAASNVEQWERRVTAEPRPQNRPLGGLTPLLFAARAGCALCAEHLIKGGADLNLTDPNRISPLLMALLNGRFDTAKVLIEAGADVNKWDMWGRAPLYAAVDIKTIPTGGYPDRPSLDVTTASDIIEFLLKADANTNMQLKLFPPYRSLGADRGGDTMLTVGTTPLIRAAKAGDTETVEQLLKFGALPNLKNWPGYTPMLAASGLGSSSRDTRARELYEAKNLEVAKLLFSVGVTINQQDERGRTPLHGAAERGWTDYVSWLLQNGADIDVKDSQGKSAFDYAEAFPKIHTIIQSSKR